MTKLWFENIASEVGMPRIRVKTRESRSPVAIDFPNKTDMICSCQKQDESVEFRGYNSVSHYCYIAGQDMQVPR